MREKKSPHVRDGAHHRKRVFSFEELQFVFNHHMLNREQKRLWLWLAMHTMHSSPKPMLFTYHDIAKALDEEKEVIFQALSQLYTKLFYT